MCGGGGGGAIPDEENRKEKECVLVRGVGSLPDVLSVDNNIFKQYP